MSNYLHSWMEVGDEVQMMPPAGDFHLKDKNAPVVLISAGVGLTPMQAMLDTLADNGFSYPVFYLHACKNKKQHSFKTHVDSTKNFLNLQTHTWYENDIVSSENEHTGRMLLSSIQNTLPLMEGEFYLCGPLQFMLAIKQELIAMGVDDSRIHYELFGPHQDV